MKPELALRSCPAALVCTIRPVSPSLGLISPMKRELRISHLLFLFQVWITLSSQAVLPPRLYYKYLSRSLLTSLLLRKGKILFLH